MLDKIKRVIVKHKMLSLGDKVCVGVSGGVDSMALLHVLNCLKDRYRLSLVVCHLNHNLRGAESAGDSIFVKDIAKKLAIPFVGKKLSVKEIKDRKGESVQEWARKKRMEFLEQAAKRCNCNKIALGHNMDDHVETVLMRFLIGSALRGLAGIKPVRGHFIRPLIEVRRAEIERYADENRIDYVSDSTNAKTKYLRNRLRLELLPLIQKDYNPNIKETLFRMSAILDRDDEYLSKIADEVFLNVAKIFPHKISFDRKKLISLHPAIQTRLFYRAVEAMKGGAEYSPQFESFIRVLNGKKPNVTLKLHKGLYLKRDYDIIIITTEHSTKLSARQFEKKLKIPGVTTIAESGYALNAAVLNKKPARFPANPLIAWFDYKELPKTLKLRNFIPGDKMRPFGMKGHRKLKDIFIDEKIPIGKRRLIPLLTAGKEIIWVAGIRRSDMFKITSATKRVLKVEVKLEDIA